MSFWTNYHSHCDYCDGKFEPERYVERAIDFQVLAYGFSSHAPLPFDCKWCMNIEDISDYLDEISTLQRKYKGRIELYKGLEIDYIPKVIGPNRPGIEELNLDYTIGSIHFIDQFEDGSPWEVDGSHDKFLKGLKEIYHGDVKKVLQRYFQLTREMVENDCPDIVGHMDKIKVQNIENKFYSEFSSWYKKEIMQTLETIAAAGAIVEVNTRGIYTRRTVHTYPSMWVLEKIQEMNIPITLNSDAHHPEEIINKFGSSCHMLREIGFEHIKVLFQNEWQDAALDSNGLKLPQYA
ncbi:histidinol-phosphatase [Fulvivirgaceae bacterium BMA10]|uniref:Histidinol-phosphatase n=1 Tax=Splendidivirga corallicola TaxID=3051826 RepID=A0ABT8KW07_9BACT|nr:histidinol-phosphatase [Fulvivirgaceae bacterium BMA10]